VTDLLAKLAAVFVEPAPEAGPQRRRRVAVTPPAPCVGVIASPRHALPVGAAVALVVARSVRARRALLCTWPPGDWAAPALQAPAGAGARRLRRSLAARGIDTTATGSLVRTLLPDAPEDAVATAERALAAAAAPAVLVLAGARPEILDELLLTQDAIVVAADPEADRCVVDLAVATLNARHPVVSACSLPLGPLGRALAAAGVTAPLGANRPLAPVLEAVT